MSRPEGARQRARLRHLTQLRQCDHDTGSAVVDFALVGALLTLLFMSLVQLALVLHVRNTAIDCAAEGARFGSRADRVPEDGEQRARALLAADLSPRYADGVRDVSASQADVAGVQTVEVTMTLPLPVLGLLGSVGSMTVHGHAFLESQ